MHTHTYKRKNTRTNCHRNSHRKTHRHTHTHTHTHTRTRTHKHKHIECMAVYHLSRHHETYENADMYAQGAWSRNLCIRIQKKHKTADMHCACMRRHRQGLWTGTRAQTARTHMHSLTHSLIHTCTCTCRKQETANELVGTAAYSSLLLQ
jgi:hypothetical protein